MLWLVITVGSLVSGAVLPPIVGPRYCNAVSIATASFFWWATLQFSHTACCL